MSAARRPKEEKIAIYLYPNRPPVCIGRSWLNEEKIREECAWQTKVMWLKALPLIMNGRGLSPNDTVFD
jgi:hypothetical protein